MHGVTATLSSGVALERALERFGIPADRIGDLDEWIFRRTSFHIDEFSPVPWAKSVRVPTLLYQVRDDLYTRPSDVQGMYDNIPIEEKDLFWIEGTTRRWDGYAHFQGGAQQGSCVVRDLHGSAHLAASFVPLTSAWAWSWAQVAGRLVELAAFDYVRPGD